MRPKKVILLVDSQGARSDVFAFVLDVHGYRVIKARNISEVLSCPSCDLIVTQIVGLVVPMKHRFPDTPVMAIGKDSLADVWIRRKTFTTFDALQLIRMMLRRKRGPRKLFAPSHHQVAA